MHKLVFVFARDGWTTGDFFELKKKDFADETSWVVPLARRFDGHTGGHRANNPMVRASGSSMSTRPTQVCARFCVASADAVNLPAGQICRTVTRLSHRQ
jgi:hypothetical protein